MAKDTTSKALNIASDMVSACDQFMSALETLAALKAEKESAGIDFADAAFLTALENSSIKHLDAAILNAVLSSTETTKVWLETNFHDDNFHQARP